MNIHEGKDYAANSVAFKYDCSMQQIDIDVDMGRLPQKTCLQGYANKVQTSLRIHTD